MVAPAAAAVIGAIAGVLVILSVEWLDRAAVDDPAGSISVHAAAVFGACWRWAFSRGCQRKQWLAQLAGVATLLVFVLPMTYSLNWLLNRFYPQRVPAEGEPHGLDLYELGAGAYPEFVTRRDDFETQINRHAVSRSLTRCIAGGYRPEEAIAERRKTLRINPDDAPGRHRMEYAVAFRDRNAALCALRPLFSFCRRSNPFAFQANSFQQVSALLRGDVTQPLRRLSLRCGHPCRHRFRAAEVSVPKSRDAADTSVCATLLQAAFSRTPNPPAFTGGRLVSVAKLKSQDKDRLLTGCPPGPAR